jgi:hypothetical protein
MASFSLSMLKSRWQTQFYMYLLEIVRFSMLLVHLVKASNESKFIMCLLVACGRAKNSYLTYYLSFYLWQLTHLSIATSQCHLCTYMPTWFVVCKLILVTSVYCSLDIKYCSLDIKYCSPDIKYCSLDIKYCSLDIKILLTWHKILFTWHKNTAHLT